MKYDKEKLESKAWYRFLKVLYIIAYIPILFGVVMSIWSIFSGERLGSVSILIIIGIIIVEFIKKATLYIILGSKK